MENHILLSADGDVSLYRVNKEILDQFDSLIESFYHRKKTNSYDETAFVIYLKGRFGDSSISFIRVIGHCTGTPNRIIQNNGERFGKDVTKDYEDVVWYNF